MFRFFHEKFDVYRVSLEFVDFVEGFDTQWFARNADRRRQLSRAADSIPPNIAEGLGHRSHGLRKKHLKIAMASASECHSILDLLRRKGAKTDPALHHLRRVGQMLNRMLQ